MKKNGFKDLSESVHDLEPTMSLSQNDFVPYEEIESSIICRKISTKKDFKLWIDVVNTVLHGWDMIDAEHYFIWVESNNVNIYMAEINGIAVSMCATILNNNTASLEFVSTLKEYRRRKAPAFAFLYERLGFKRNFNNTVMKFEF